MDIIHRNNILLTDTDYCLCFGVDIFYDLFSNHASTSIEAFARNSQSQSNSLCFQRICRTIEVHRSYRLLIPPSQSTMYIIANHYSHHHNDWLQWPFPNLVTLVPLLHRMDTHQQITNFRVIHNKFCAIVGLSTPLVVATLHQPSRHDAYLHGINVTSVVPSSENSQHARRSSKMAKISSIISISLSIVLKYTVTSSILFAFGIVTQLHIVGNSRCSSSLNFKQFAPFKWP